MKTVEWPAFSLAEGLLDSSYRVEKLALLLVAADDNSRASSLEELETAWGVAMSRLLEMPLCSEDRFALASWVGTAIIRRETVISRARGLLRVRAVAMLPGLNYGALPEAGTERRRSTAPAPAGA